MSPYLVGFIYLDDFQYFCVSTLVVSKDSFEMGGRIHSFSGGLSFPWGLCHYFLNFLGVGWGGGVFCFVLANVDWFRETE